MWALLAVLYNCILLAKREQADTDGCLTASVWPAILAWTDVIIETIDIVWSRQKCQ